MLSNSEETYALAKKLYDAGYFVIPVNEDKAPVKGVYLGQYYQEGRRLPWHFIDDKIKNNGLAISLFDYLNGPKFRWKVIDIDHQCNRTFATIWQYVNQLSLGKYILRERTAKGIHLWYQSFLPANKSTEVLARNADGTVNCELLGGRRLVLIPCPWHPKRQWVQLTKHSLLTPPPKMPENLESRLIAHIKRMCHEELSDEIKREKELKKAERKPLPKKSIDTHFVGQDCWGWFESAYSWEDVLLPHGWLPIGDGRWRRPGTDKQCSAEVLDDEVFYNFSSNAEGLEACVGYRKGSLYAALNYNGDKSAAYSEIKSLYQNEIVKELFN